MTLEEKKREFFDEYFKYKTVKGGLTVINPERVWQGIEELVKEQMRKLTEKVIRVEVIDNEGRSYVNWDDKNKVELSFQDNRRTLKVFISNEAQ